MDAVLEGIDVTYALRFAVALALGFLVGLERQSSAASHKNERVFAGVRTYSLISLYGFGTAWLARQGIELVLPLGMLTITALAIAGYMVKVRQGRVGWTSEVAVILTFITGALTVMADLWVPIAIGVINTLLLSEKGGLERFVDRLDKAEFLAVLKFLLVTLIVLPVIPDRSFTRFGLNPAEIWKIVILVSSIGFVGYFLTKRFGSRLGLWLSGLLGGIVSSTAVSIATGRIAQRDPAHARDALQSAIVASSVMYARILVLIWIIRPAAAGTLLFPCLSLMVIGLALSYLGKARSEGEILHAESTLENPFEVKPALIFAVFFTILTILTVFVRESFGATGLIVLSFIVGVVDIDPYILSVVRQGDAATIGSMAVLIAMMSNTAAKGAYFAFLGQAVRKQTIWRFGLWALLHLPFVFLL